MNETRFFNPLELFGLVPVDRLLVLILLAELLVFESLDDLLKLGDRLDADRELEDEYEDELDDPVDVPEEWIAVVLGDAGGRLEVRRFVMLVFLSAASSSSLESYSSDKTAALAR